MPCREALVQSESVTGGLSLTGFQTIAPTCWIRRMRRKLSSVMLSMVTRVQFVWRSCICEMRCLDLNSSCSCVILYVQRRYTKPWQ